MDRLPLLTGEGPLRPVFVRNAVFVVDWRASR